MFWIVIPSTFHQNIIQQTQCWDLRVSNSARVYNIHSKSLTATLGNLLVYSCISWFCSKICDAPAESTGFVGSAVSTPTRTICWEVVRRQWSVYYEIDLLRSCETIASSVQASFIKMSGGSGAKDKAMTMTSDKASTSTFPYTAMCLIWSHNMPLDRLYPFHSIPETVQSTREISLTEKCWYEK